MQIKKAFEKLTPKGLAIILGVFLVPSIVLNFYLHKQSQVWRQDIKVEGVIDGDTLVLDGKVRLRLRHADAPELEYCGGEEAKQLLSQLVEGERVRIRERILDQRGRPLALVYVGDTLVNQEMIESGWARYHHDTSDIKELLKEAGSKAKEEKRGIYGKCWEQEENSQNAECNIKGNIDKNNSSIKRYYLPHCAHYKFTIIEKDRGEQWFCTEDQAQKAGYVKAKSCH